MILIITSHIYIYILIISIIYILIIYIKKCVIILYEANIKKKSPTFTI
jgi:hypothetical protein